MGTCYSYLYIRHNTVIVKPSERNKKENTIYDLIMNNFPATSDQILAAETRRQPCPAATDKYQIQRTVKGLKNMR